MNSIYLFISLRHPGRVKIGWSGDCENRRKTLSRDLRSVVVGGGVWMLFAPKVEKALHGIYAPLQAKMPDHAGFREWFWIINPLTMFFAALFLWVQSATGWVVYLPVILLVFPLPLDLIICYALYWIFQYVILCYVLPPAGAVLNVGLVYLKFWALKILN